MQHVLETGKRAISAAVAAATIAFSIGAGVLVAPTTSHAAAAGDRIKSASLSTVYYYGYDGMRYTYPNLNTYKSWHMAASGAADFSGVSTVSDSTISDITLGGNVVMRPGSYWIKVTSDPKTYAVARNGNIHWIESESVATAFAGSNWNQRIVDVADVFFTDYTVGSSLMSATAYEGMSYLSGGSTYISWGGAKRLVSDAGKSANGLQSMFVMDGSGIVDSALAAGSDLTAKDSSVSDDAQTVTAPVVATGALTVSAASSMPAGASLPQGANSVEVFRFNATAGSAAAAFTGLTLSMIGAGAAADVSNVYLYEGNTRLTDSKTINSSTRQVTFSNLGLSVAANSTRTFTVRVTTSATAIAADTFGFKINASSDVVDGVPVGGSFPIVGNTFTVTGADVGSLKIEATGSISNPSLGAVDATIGQFKITDSLEAASLTAVTVKVLAAGDHSNYKLWKGTTQLATGTVSGKWVIFNLTSPLAITKGGNVTLSVSANIGGAANDKIVVYIDNSVDVVATGASYGFGLSVDIGATAGTYDGVGCSSTDISGNCSGSTVQGGELTFAFTGPSASDVQTDSTNVSLLNFSMTAAQAVTVQDLNVSLTSSTNDLNDGTDAFLTNIQLVNADNGAVLSGPFEISGTGSNSAQTVRFTDDISMIAGQTLHLSVRVNIDSATPADSVYKATLKLTGAPSTATVDAEDQNGDALVAADIVPGSDIAGYNQTARTASVTFALASTPGDVTTVRGTAGVSVVAFNVTAGTASSVKITDFVLTTYGDANNAGAFTVGGIALGGDAVVVEHVSACSLYEGSTLLAGPKSSDASTGKIDFNTIRWTVAAGAVTTLTVKCDFSNTATGGAAGFAFDLKDSNGTDITAEDSSGNSLAAAAILGGDNINGATPTNSVLLLNSGSLAVAIGSDMPTADYMLTNSSLNLASTFRFTSTNESFELQTLSFSEEQAEDDMGAADSNAYANNISLVTINYPKADGTTGVKTAAMSANVAKFSALDVRVAVGAPATVKVYVNVATSNRYTGGSALSNEKVRMALYANATADSFYKAVGLGSGITFTDTDSDGSGTDLSVIGDDPYATDGVPTFVVRETKPTVSLSSSSPSGTATVGRNEVLRFNVAANANQDVVVKNLTFKMSSSDNAGTQSGWNNCDTDGANDVLLGAVTTTADFDIYDLTKDSGTTMDTANTDWTLYKSTGAVCDATSANVVFAKVVLPTASVVTKGTTHTYALYFDATGASSADNDTVRFDLPVDPILSTWLNVANASNVGDLSETSNTLAVDSGAAFAVGDIINYSTGDSSTVAASDEKMLVVGISTNDLYVVRGYLGSKIYPSDATLTGTAYDTTDDIQRLPGTFLWQDNGVSAAGSATNSENFWGSYLVKSLTVTGGTMQF